MNDQKSFSSRLDRERSFHNARFSAHSGAGIGSKYYLALHHWYRDYYSRIMKMEVSHVLELGSGLESLALQTDQTPFLLNSIDISEEAIAYARAHTRLFAAEFSVADAHQTEFPNNSFDLVIGRGILHHLDLKLACAEIRRILKPNGKIIFGEPLDCNVLINLYRKLTPNIRTRDERPLSAEMLQFIQSQFSDIQIRYYGFLTLIPSIFRLKSPHWLHVFDGFLLNTIGLGPYFAWACLICSSKKYS